MSRILVLLSVVVLSPAVNAFALEASWRAGMARVSITPELPIWLSGYAARDKPAAEKLDDLWAKALVLEDARGQQTVLVTMDLVGIDRAFAREVCRRIEAKHQLPRAAIVLATSHTHSGPVVGGNLAAMYTFDEAEAARVDRYAQQLVEKIVQVVGEAFDDLAPARLARGASTASIAVNRRNNVADDVERLRAASALKGPVDHAVPVLVIQDGDERLRAIVAGYACHATVLSGYAVSGDWPGAAQREIERRHPEAMALFWAGCGADQNPLPRRSVELMELYGRQLADAVDKALDGSLKPLQPTLRAAYEEIELPFGPLPSRAELERVAAGQNLEASWARYLIAEWDRDGKLPSEYPYPVQAWRLGHELSWVFLGGEVVVDYALRLKAELGPDETWVASYANDVMGYIPSRRVLAEGGYEGATARFPYGLPAVWAPSVELQIVDAVHQVVGEIAPVR